MIRVDMDKIKEIKARFNRLENLNEENIKIKIVLDILISLGYDSETFDFEHEVYHRDQIADIAIKINDNEYFYVEVKNGKNNLSERDIIQLAGYLNIKGIEWGLLTNGKELILINNKITSLPNKDPVLGDRIIFRIDLMTRKEMDCLDFVSKEAIFDTKVTNYFRDMAQFKAYKYPYASKNVSGYGVYKSTLKGFFTYYANKHNEYIPINEIRTHEFKAFLEYEQEKKKGINKSIKSQNTFKNKYSHIRSMLHELKKQKYIPNHNFNQERDKLIEKLEYKEINKDKNFFNEENVSEILKFMESTQSPVRNKVIFLLSIYMGLERSTLKNIETRMFDLEKNIIKIDERTIPLPSKLGLLVKELIKENKSKRIKGKYLFYTNYFKKYNVMTESAINDLFIRFKDINPNDEKWTVFSPQYIRECLIEKLFENNYSIEEISYLIGMDLKNISKYISSDKINSQVDLFKNRRLQRKHPFEKFLEI